jgi:hypothetical protein
MSAPTTIVRAKLIPKIINSDGSNFIVESQKGNAYNLFNGVGVRVQCGFFEEDGITLITDASSIVSATHTIRTGVSTFMTQVKAGPFPIITAEQWNNRTAQHVEFAFSDVDTSVQAGAYTSVIFGNASDALAGVDFCCVRPLTILDSGIPSSFTNPDNEASIFAMLQQFVQNQLGGFLKKVNGNGVTLTLKSPSGLKTLIIGLDDDGNPIDNRNL